MKVQMAEDVGREISSKQITSSRLRLGVNRKKRISGFSVPGTTDGEQRKRLDNRAEPFMKNLREIPPSNYFPLLHLVSTRYPRR